MISAALSRPDFNNHRDIPLTSGGLEELRDMLADARRSQKHWHDFLEDCVSDPDIIARVKEKDPQ